ncbi:MAG: VWA domain-containing protein [Kiritimatiellae bacterium]|nr:VWA domain-containing protein [Kiritimatiellia bacterium]
MKEFVLQWPWALLLLVALPPLARLLAAARRKRTEVLERLGGQAYQQHVSRDVLRLAALALLILALARPGLDPRYLPISGAGRDVVFALDVSQSMLAADTPPSRLEAAKQGVRDALDALQAERVGLVVYAGSANILCPLTRDMGFVRYMLDQAAPRTVDFGGSQLISAVEKAIDQVFAEGREGYQDLVLLTDGEDHGSHHKRVAELLAEAEAGLLIIGIGDAREGARIPQVQADGRTTWLQHKGAVVTTHLNREGLAGLADMCADASYVEAGTAPFDLGHIYAGYALDRPTGAVAQGASVVIYREAAFALLPFVLLLIVLGELDVRQWPKWLSSSAAISALLVCSPCFASEPPSSGAEDVASRFEATVALQESEQYEEAIAQYAELTDHWKLSPAATAAAVFNRGLCHQALATRLEQISARDALPELQAAQHCFLRAMRANPAMLRPGRRLDALAGRIREIEEQLAAEDQQKDAQSQPNDDQGDPSDMGDEDWEMAEEGEYDESMSSSMPAQGDFAQASDMQPLPAPNYSADEILSEEKESQQFREQKRAKASASKVEKDW